jgi:predicted nucleic acid-binding protein
MATEPSRWVLDTTAYTHLCRAGHGDLLARLAPTGVVLVPSPVNTEIENGRESYPGIPAVSTIDWVELIVPTEEEEWTALQVKAQLGGGPTEHLGECAVIACAFHRRLTAIIDEEAAVAQAERLRVEVRGTVWVVIEAYKRLFERDRQRTASVIDDLLATDMWLPVESGEGLLTWAWEEGLLP